MMKRFFKILKIILLILCIFCLSKNVFAETLQIEDSTDYNYYIDLRANQYLIGRTTIQDSIITTTCSYLSNSYGCGIQVPLKNTFKMEKDREYTFTILVITDGKQVQPSTWKSNINFVSDVDSALNIGGSTKGVWRMYNYDTSENTTYNADFSIEFQGNNIYKLTYKLKSKKSQNVKIITYAFGEDFNGSSTTGTLSFQYFMVDATNEDIVNAVNDLNNTIKDTTVPNFDQTKFLGYLKDNPLSLVLNLPLNLLNALKTRLTSYVCSPLSVNLPYVSNKTIQLPCINELYNKFGVRTVVEYIGTLLGAFMIMRYLLFLYKYVDDTLTVRENTWPGYEEDI